MQNSPPANQSHEHAETRIFLGENFAPGCHFVQPTSPTSLGETGAESEMGPPATSMRGATQSTSAAAPEGAPTPGAPRGGASSDVPPASEHQGTAMPASGPSLPHVTSPAAADVPVSSPVSEHQGTTMAASTPSPPRVASPAPKSEHRGSTSAAADVPMPCPVSPPPVATNPGVDSLGSSTALDPVHPSTTNEAAPGRPVTHLQKRIRKPKTYTDDTVRYANLADTYEPSCLKEALASK